jgi:hypothetical protein
MFQLCLLGNLLVVVVVGAEIKKRVLKIEK